MEQRETLLSRPVRFDVSSCNICCAHPNMAYVLHALFVSTCRRVISATLILIWLLLFKMVEFYRLILGMAIIIQALIMLILNVFVLIVIIKGRLYAQKDNCVFILVFFNISCETCQLIVHLSYLGPAILTESWLFAGQDALGVTIVSTIFLGLWYLGGMMQILFATNRFVVICFPGHVFFTRLSVTIFISICSIASVGMVSYSQLLSPCCRITLDPFYYSYSYLNFNNTNENLSMYFVDLPIDTFTSVYCALSYIVLFVYIHNLRIAGKHAKQQEVRICIQFVLMGLIYTIAWLTFFLYPVLGIRNKEAFSITLILFFFNCGANSIIYLTLNNEVRNSVNKTLNRKVFRISNLIESTRTNTII